MATQVRPTQDPTAKIDPCPRHVAVIMDGNGRWARERGLPRLGGHRAGTDNIQRVIRSFADHGVDFLTIYAFSTENWSRPSKEVKGLWRILEQVIRWELEGLHKNGVRLLHIGRHDRLHPPLRKAIQEAVDLTRANTGLTLAIALDYGGRAEIVEAIQRMIRAGLDPEEVTEESLASFLYTAGIPDPDLIIRTAGEMRLSNFLTWQSAYAEYYTTPAYWPDFDQAEIERALRAYSKRERRFGGVTKER